MAISKKTKKNTDLGITVIIIIGILGVLNFFSYQIFYRWDITQNKDYSISSASKRLSSDLDDLVKMKAYFSNELPNEFISLPQDVKDILDEYANYSSGKLQYEFIDPTENEELEREALGLGIPTLQFNVFEKDKAQIVKGYLGLVIQHGDKTEIIPVVESTRNLEYQISLALKKVTSSDSPIVGLVTSHGVKSTDNDIPKAHETLSQLYEVRLIDLATTPDISLDLKTLVIPGPTNVFSEDELKSIDSFVTRGGSLLVLADGVKIENGLMTNPNETNIGTLLELYGVRVNKDLILDTSASMASFTSGFFQFSLPYPYWPKIIQEGFDQENAAVSSLELAVLPWTSSLDIINEKISEGTAIKELIKTTSEAWRQTENFNLNPQQTFRPSGEQKQYVLAALVSGKIKSAYGEESAEDGRIIVVSDSDFITDRIVANSPDNLILFQNLVDSLSLDEDLINIRSKGISERPIKELEDSDKMSIRYLNVFGLTIAVLVFGLVRYYIRKKSRFVDEL